MFATDRPRPPGPRSLPLLGHARHLAADRLGFLADLAREYGDVSAFRVGPYRVWQFAHPDLVHQVLVTEARRYRKSPILRRARLVLGDGLLTAEGEHHRRHRRVLQEAFHSRAVAAYDTSMTRRAAEQADRWLPDTPVDAHEEAMRVTLLVAGETLLGTDLEQDVDTVAEAMADALSAYRLIFVPFGWLLQRLPIGPMRRLQRARATLDELIARTIAEKRTQPGQDLLSRLVWRGDGSTALSDSEIRDEATTLLLAGHETTASAVAFAMYLLARDPDLQARLHQEIDDVVGDRRVTADDLDALPTARGVFAESVRLFPPSWAIAREATVEHVVGGHRVAPGELVVLPQWVVHRDPRWWPDPLRCDPDRWDGANTQQRPKGAFFAFGGGTRQCIGQGFAETEGPLVLVTMLHRWRLRLLAGDDVALDPLLTLRPRDGVWMVPRPRS